MPFALTRKTGFSWIGEYDITADELLSGAGGNTATKTEQAERLILDLLADGKELASEEIVKAAAEAGISERTGAERQAQHGAVFWMQGASAVNGTTSSRRSSRPNPQAENAKCRPFALCTFALFTLIVRQ